MRELSIGEAAHHALIAPLALSSPTNGPRLMARLDPETYQPYYYFENDVERQAARRYGVLDTTVSNPSWMTGVSDAGPSAAASDVQPPERSDFPYGEEGGQQFHDARADYYLRCTGELLEGAPDAQFSLAQQNERYHNLLRDRRVRSP